MSRGGRHISTPIGIGWPDRAGQPRGKYIQKTEDDETFIIIGRGMTVVCVKIVSSWGFISCIDEV